MGDAVIYAEHVGVVIHVRQTAGGTTVVESADGDFGGTKGSGMVVFAKTSTVKINTWYPGTGRGAAGRIIGYVRAN